MMLKIRKPATCNWPTKNRPSRSPRTGSSGARIASQHRRHQRQRADEAQQHEDRRRRVGERQLHHRPVAGPADDDDREIEIDDPRPRRARDGRRYHRGGRRSPLRGSRRWRMRRGCRAAAARAAPAPRRSPPAISRFRDDRRRTGSRRSPATRRVPARARRC